MSTENKTVDLVVEANVAYGMIIQISDVTVTNGINVANTPVNITGASFRGSIRKELSSASPVIENFSIAVQSPTDGIALIRLTKAQTQNIMSKASTQRDKYNPRIRFVGYYDILMTRAPAAGEALEFRILEGKLYVSDGVTS